MHNYNDAPMLAAAQCRAEARLAWDELLLATWNSRVIENLPRIERWVIPDIGGEQALLRGILEDPRFEPPSAHTLYDPLSNIEEGLDSWILGEPNMPLDIRDRADAAYLAGVAIAVKLRRAALPEHPMTATLGDESLLHLTAGVWGMSIHRNEAQLVAVKRAMLSLWPVERALYRVNHMGVPLMHPMWVGPRCLAGVVDAALHPRPHRMRQWLALYSSVLRCKIGGRVGYWKHQVNEIRRAWS